MNSEKNSEKKRTRSIVMRHSQGDVSLQMGKYITEEDVKEMKERVGKMNF